MHINVMSTTMLNDDGEYVTITLKHDGDIRLKASCDGTDLTIEDFDYVIRVMKELRQGRENMIKDGHFDPSQYEKDDASD